MLLARFASTPCCNNKLSTPDATCELICRPLDCLIGFIIIPASVVDHSGHTDHQKEV